MGGGLTLGGILRIQSARKDFLEKNYNQACCASSSTSQWGREGGKGEVSECAFIETTNWLKGAKEHGHWRGL